MQQRQIDNLKVLINASPILSEVERDEWRQLMEVMNDKQLLELEHILTAYKKPNISVEVAPHSAPISLSHIVNLPKSAPSTPRELPKPQPAVLVQKKSSGFAEKLKNMLREKDLPAAQSPVRLEDHSEVAPAPQIVLRPIVSEPKKPSSGISKPKPVSVPVIKPLSRVEPAVKSKLPEGTGPVQAGLRNFPMQSLGVNKVPENTTININNSVVSIEPVKVSPNKVLGDIQIPQIREVVKTQSSDTSVTQNEKKDANSFRAGLTDTNVLLTAKFLKEQEDLKNKEILEKKAREARPSLSTLKPLRPLSVKVESIEDVKNLSGEIWHSEDHASLQKAISGIIARYGYHETVFQLEHSALYEMYINTGLKILKDASNFEMLEKEGSQTYLSRNDFEEFTDLLRKIQAVT